MPKQFRKKSYSCSKGGVTSLIAKGHNILMHMIDSIDTPACQVLFVNKFNYNYFYNNLLCLVKIRSHISLLIADPFCQLIHKF